MKNEEILSSLVMLQKATNAFQDGTFRTEKGVGYVLLGCNSDGVHIANDCFIELSKDHPVQYESRNCKVYPHQLHFYYKDLKFFAIFREEQFQKLFEEKITIKEA